MIAKLSDYSSPQATRPLPSQLTTPSSLPSTAESIARLIGAMEPISLAEMDRVALLNRVDTKCVLSDTHLLALLRSIESEFQILEVDGLRDSPYATLYFDTPGLACYLDHHNGKLNRSKFRIRKYVSSGTCFLEVKSKTNRGRTDKRRVAIEDFQDSFSHPSRSLRVDENRLAELTPQIWTYFSRITLVNRYRVERVTLDRNIEFRCGDSVTRLPNLVIAEIKQEADDRYSPVREELRRLTVRPMRISKYCLGSAMLKPHLKQNRFKRKLLAIQKFT